MENTEKVGEVKRTPLGALKKICQESVMEKVIASDLPKFERLTDERMKAKDQITMFSEDSMAKHGITLVTAEEFEEYDR